MARLCAALRSETNPDHRHTGTFECRNSGVDTLDVSELPLFRMKVPGAVGRLARLFMRHLRMSFYCLGGLLFGVRPHRRARRSSQRGRRVRLCRAARWRRWRHLLAHRLTIVIADHHDDNLGSLGSNDLARNLWPLGITPCVIADEAGLGAMFANDADLGLLGVRILKPIGEPVGVSISHDYDLDRGVLARRR